MLIEVILIPIKKIRKNEISFNRMILKSNKNYI